MTMLTVQQARNVARATEARMGSLPTNWLSKVGWNREVPIDSDRLMSGLEAIYRGGR